MQLRNKNSSQKDGSPVDISLTISVLRDKTGCIIGTVGITQRHYRRKATYEKSLRRK